MDVKGFDKAQAQYDNAIPDDYYTDEILQYCPYCGEDTHQEYDTRYKRKGSYCLECNQEIK